MGGQSEAGGWVRCGGGGVERAGGGGEGGFGGGVSVSVVNLWVRRGGGGTGEEGGRRGKEGERSGRVKGKKVFWKAVGRRLDAFTCPHDFTSSCRLGMRIIDSRDLCAGMV